MSEVIKITGIVKVKITRPDGSQEKYKGKNLVMTYGLEQFAEMIVATADKITHLAFGDSGAAVNDGQLALQGTEHTRIALNEARVGTTVTYEGTWNVSGATVSLAEMGLFDAATAGNLFARWLVPTTLLEDGTVVNVTWSLKLEVA